MPSRTTAVGAAALGVDILGAVAIGPLRQPSVRLDSAQCGSEDFDYLKRSSTIFILIGGCRDPIILIYQ